MKKSVALTTSLTIHAALLLGCMVVLSSPKKETPLPNAIPAMLYQAAQVTPKAAPRKIADTGILKKPHQSIQRSQTNASIPTRNPNASQLLQLLHSAIAQYQTFPEGLTSHGETVTLSMEISPDGTLSNLSVKHSSGNELIDQATLQAAQAASPIAGIKTLLSKSTSFSVDIVYA